MGIAFAEGACVEGALIRASDCGLWGAAGAGHDCCLQAYVMVDRERVCVSV